MPSAIRNRASTFITRGGKRVAVNTITIEGAKEPRLRFDRTALGLVKRLQASLAKSVPDGKTVVVTVTAPIRQDSKTGVELQERIGALLATRRAELSTTLYGNSIRVRVLKGGADRTARLVGFVHNREPGPACLVDVTRCVLASLGSGKRASTADRWLIIGNRDGLAPLATIRQVCLALRARTVFKRILVAEGERLTAL